jgi:DNA repair exonuclease SbcCD ATPase subunit
MSPTPTTLNPSQTVERIREIIVGRHLERLEGRVSRLERIPAVPEQNPTPDIFEDRLLMTEAQVEALQDHLQRFESSREELEHTAAMQREDAQRLATQIHEIAREKADATVIPAVEKLDRKLGAWLSEWQVSLQHRLDVRDHDLSARIKSDLTELKEGFEKRLTALETQMPDNVGEGFGRIAEAAKALADSAALLSRKRPPVA